MMRWDSLLMAAMLVPMAVPAVAQEKLVAVPFVGCPADSMSGPRAAPKSGLRPALPASLAAKLAYYSGPYDMGILAPRGWVCSMTSGSNGSTLIVTPKRRPGDMLEPAVRHDPIVAVNLSLGSTSGRFSVASIAGPLFPAAADFVKGVKDEPQSDLKFVTLPNDTLNRLNDTVIEFTTPADSEGLGTNYSITQTGWPIDGVAILLPTEDMDLVMIRVRLAPEMRYLAPMIIRHKTEMISQCECSSDKRK